LAHSVQRSAREHLHYSETRRAPIVVLAPISAVGGVELAPSVFFSPNGMDEPARTIPRMEPRADQCNATLCRCLYYLPASNLNSVRRAARGRRSTIAENRRALYQEGVGSSRRLLAGADEKASSLCVVDALAFCSLTEQRSPDLLGSPQALAIPRRRRRSSCSFSTQMWR
jgi:hypothetical protein